MIESDIDSIGLRAELTVEHDVAEFERLVRGRPGPPGGSPARSTAASSPRASPHECFARDRERLADAYEDALALAAAARLARGDLDGARAAALELLARDPLREEAHQTLIAVYGASGSRSQVLRQFRRLEALLDGEIGERPCRRPSRPIAPRWPTRSSGRAGASLPRAFRGDPILAFAASVPEVAPRTLPRRPHPAGT